MKVVLSMLALMGVVILQAQDVKPSFTQEGDMVKATYFHENGQIAQEGYYLDGKLHGEWQMFAASGEKIALGQYTFGQKSGKWFFWHQEGLKEVDYLKNQVVNVTLWNNKEAIVLNK